ncbi:MAG TPA: hydroxymethylbilane synthase, partial [Thermoleophilaceae bacterium]
MAELLDAEVELVPIRTSGDAGAVLGDKSRFVKEIEDALMRRDVDLAVHSAKDVPGELPDGLSIVGVPARADARDSLCGTAGSLDGLPEGASVGTSSLRRRTQLLALRPDLDVVELRGNVDTRLRRLAEGEYDAVVLAAAGLARLSRDEGEPIDQRLMTPAPGLGCLALEARTDDERASELAAAVTDRAALQALTAERAVVSALDASCRTPLAAHAEHVDGGLVLSAFAGLPDGSE